MAAVLAGVAAYVYGQTRSDLRAALDMGLRSRAQVIAVNARTAGTRIGGGPHENRLIDPDEAFAQVLSPSGTVLDSTPAVRRAPLVPAPELRRVRGPTFVDAHPAGLDPSRLLVVPIRTRRGGAFAVVGATLSNSDDALTTLARELEIALPAALLVASLAGWLLAGAALRPVERMRREAEEISATDPARRLPVPATGDTLARLATTLNATFDRLQTALDAERRFVDEASHELRTPLAILKAELDTALEDAASADALQRALRGAHEEVDHLVRIAEGLLVLARAEGGRIPVHPEPVSLCTLVAASAAAFEGRAAAIGVELLVDAADAPVHVDPTRVRQAVDNVIDNALRHSPPGAVVRVVAGVEDGVVSITVEDGGPGFDADVLGRAFVPFRRGRSSAYPGSGLGLAIVAAVAEAHGGSAAAENLPGGGARIGITLAAAAPTAGSAP